MKQNLIFKTIVLAVLAFAFASCHNNQAEQTLDEMTDSTIAQFCPEGFDALYALQDAPQQMPVKLFEGINDSLLNALLPQGVAEASMNAFLLCGQGRMILFDTGVGGALMHNLDSLGIAPEQITDICITHLHFDHIGGLVSKETAKANFPNATLHIARAEKEFWAPNNEEVNSVLKCYEGRIHLFDNDVDIPGVHAMQIPGHTPGHTVYDLGTIIIAGDILHAVALQVEHPEFSAVFDTDRQLASEQRQQLFEQVRQRHIPLAGMHFPAPFFITL